MEDDGEAAIVPVHDGCVDETVGPLVPQDHNCNK